MPLDVRRRTQGAGLLPGVLTQCDRDVQEDLGESVIEPHTGGSSEGQAQFSEPFSAPLEKLLSNTGFLSS